MTEPFDANGNPDVMGARILNPASVAAADALRLEFNALAAKLQGAPGQNAESARLFAIARTNLEISCMAAVKAISRSQDGPP